ncbi:MAG: hypothetical protein ABW184_13270 [Sphingobium sp.]
MASIAGGPRRVNNDDRFFLIGAYLMAAVLVGGFSLQFLAGRSRFDAPWFVHAHALIFFGWVVIYVAQTWLATRGASALHRRLGWFATGWVVLMVVFGIAVTVALVRRGAVPFFFTPAYFLIMNPLSILTFAGLTAAAIVKRRETAWHRRLHFSGMAILLGPGLGRLLPLPLMIPHAGHAVFVGVILFPIAGVIADLRRTGRVHPGWWWGIATITVMQIAMDVLAYGGPGGALYAAITAGSPGASVAPLDYPPLPPPFR